MTTRILSILIPAVFERGLGPLYENLLRQTAGRDDVEILALFDNRQRSTGLKRQALLNMAEGRYIVCLDDDDSVHPYFIAKLTNAIHCEPGADVVVYNSQASLNGENPFVVRTGIEFENEQCHKDSANARWQNITRKPWAWCAWNSKLAKAATFPDGYIDDDWFWLRQMMPHVKVQARIDEVLHFYQYNAKTSLSNQGKPTT